MCSDYLSKLAISWLLYRDDVSLCPRVHQVGFLPLYLVKPKLTAGLVGVLLDLTKGLGLVLMRVNPVWFIAGLSKKINGSPFESKSLIALCTYVSSLWIFFPLFYLLLSPFSISHSLILILSLHHCHVCFYYFFISPSTTHPTQSVVVICLCRWYRGELLDRFFSLLSLVIRQGKAALSTVFSNLWLWSQPKSHPAVAAFVIFFSELHLNHAPFFLHNRPVTHLWLQLTRKYKIHMFCCHCRGPSCQY